MLKDDILESMSNLKARFESILGILIRKLVNWGKSVKVASI